MSQHELIFKESFSGTDLRALHRLSWAGMFKAMILHEWTPPALTGELLSLRFTSKPGYGQKQTANKLFFSVYLSKHSHFCGAINALTGKPPNFSRRQQELMLCSLERPLVCRWLICRWLFPFRRPTTSEKPRVHRNSGTEEGALLWTRVKRSQGSA